MSADTMALPYPGVTEKKHPKSVRLDEDTQKAPENLEMNDPTPISNQSPVEKDNLEQIKGIGPSYAQTLYEIGIHTFEQMAASNSQDLASLLQKHGLNISVKQIDGKNWIGQALTLAQKKQDSAITGVEAFKKVKTAEAKSSEDIKKPRQKNWRELADFFVSFGYSIDPDGQEQLQTKILHDQGNCDEKWDGISIQKLIHWMISQADLPVTPELETFLGIKDPVNEHLPVPEIDQEVQLEIKDLWIELKQTSVTDKNVESLAVLQTEARLVLSGPDAVELTSYKNAFTVDIYLVNTDNRQSEPVATVSDYLMPGELIYEIQETFHIPPIGSYQLIVVASLLPPASLVTHIQGPIIRVKSKSKATPQH